MFDIDDFNVILIDMNEYYIRLEELNKMIECGVITINKEQLEKYKNDTRIVRL